jgi:hypothetical protein
MNDRLRRAGSVLTAAGFMILRPLQDPFRLGLVPRLLPDVLACGHLRWAARGLSGGWRRRAARALRYHRLDRLHGAEGRQPLVGIAGSAIRIPARVPRLGVQPLVGHFSVLARLILAWLAPTLACADHN